MTKYNQLTQAEHLYIYDKKSLAEIGMQLGLSRRILFYWKKEYKWDEKRLEVEHTKYRFSNELIDFARKMMNKISTDIDNNQKTPPPEIYSLTNILKNIPLVKQYTDSLQPEQKQEKKGLTPDIVRQIEREILGME
ncbi:MAG: hypothetical protein IJ003_03320 [Candidatus Gastranaerophilales bacterium]|nr:hypothetical protein [Candidatus Gastranaerophilales bacterium]